MFGAAGVCLTMPLPAATVFDAPVGRESLLDSRMVLPGGLSGSGRIPAMALDWSSHYLASSNLSNPSGIPAAVRFDDQGSHRHSPWPLIFESTLNSGFDSGFAPAWGKIYLKGGQCRNQAFWPCFLELTAHPGSLHGLRGDPYTAIPEPGTFLLLGTGMLALGLWTRRRRRSPVPRGAAPLP